MAGAWMAAADDSVGEDDELSDASNEGALVSFAATGEPAVEGDQRAVPALGGGECGVEESPAHASATAGDVALAGQGAGVVIKGSHPDQCRDLLATDLAE